MLNRLRIGHRLQGLVAVQVAVSLIIGVVLLLALDNSTSVTAELDRKVANQAKLTVLSQRLSSGLVNTVMDVNQGVITWEKARENLARAEQDFDVDWQAYISSLNAADRKFADEVLGPEVTAVHQAFDALVPLLEAQDRAYLSLFVANDLKHQVMPFLEALLTSTDRERIAAEQLLSVSRGTQGTLWTFSLVAIGGGILLALGLGLLIYRSIAGPIGVIANTVEQVVAGDSNARTNLSGRDELNTLGTAFDKMLSERIATLTKIEEENEQLNHSVMNLLQVVFQLSQRNLTIKAEVTEDLTGPVADALNLLTTETIKVLNRVLDVSKEVAQTSQQVKTQSKTVITMAAEERGEVEQAVEELAEASTTMRGIARLALACNEAAETTIKRTEKARDTVVGTVSGINSIRDNIRETEKRIKRLGERSQEISGVVDLINTIAERTHILALNASMHAASAGEAGRGFAVVADEVQKLAENAREATSQIANLVKNIQIETADTVNAMNDAITQVVVGTKRAEEAGLQMEETRASTNELVKMVQQIATHSKAQAQTTQKLGKRAEGIRSNTQQTNEQLQEQSVYTDRLVEYSNALLEAISVFTLPVSDSLETGAGSSSGKEGVSASSYQDVPISAHG